MSRNCVLYRVDANELDIYNTWASVKILAELSFGYGPFPYHVYHLFTGRLSKILKKKQT